MNSETWPYYADDEIEAVTRILRSGRVNQWGGDRVGAFQDAFAKYCKSQHAIAVANGTVALEIALRALGVGPGDEVIVSPRSFIASASCVTSVGATPVFADIDEKTHLISSKTIQPHIGPNTRAVIPVHIGGSPCDMRSIMELAQQNNVHVIEDCAQAVGAKINDQPIGSFGDAATFSFCQDKIISTGGEGGMVLFKDEQAGAWAASYKDHGKNFTKMHNHTNNNEFAFVHDMNGTNLRMTEMQAAIGLCQLSKLDGWIKTRNENAQIWQDALDGLKCLKILSPASNITHAYYRFYALIDQTQLRPGVNRSEIIGNLNAHDVPAFTGSCCEIYREDAYAELKIEPRSVASSIADWTLAFLVHPTLDQEKLKTTALNAAKLLKSYQAQ